MKNIKQVYGGNSSGCGSGHEGVSIPSANNEVMQNVEENNNYAKIKFPEKWVFSPEPKRCSYVQARWNNKDELSSDPTCFCPVGNKIEKIIDNEIMYKCQINS